MPYFGKYTEGSFLVCFSPTLLFFIQFLALGHEKSIAAKTLPEHLLSIAKTANSNVVYLHEFGYFTDLVYAV